MSLVEGAVPQTAARAATRPKHRRRVAFVALWLLITIVVSIAAVILARVPSARAARAAYNAATPYRCGHATPPVGIACWQGIDGQLMGLIVTHNRLGLRQTVVTLTTTGGLMSVTVEPAPALACLSPGDQVIARVSDGAVTTLFTHSGTVATAANPNVDPDIAWDAGIALLSAGLLIPCGLWLANMRRRRRGDGPDVLDAYQPLFMRLAVLAFVVGQAADVVTSAIGQAVGLSEGNSLVDVFVRSVGPVGFLLFRLPAVILVLLALSQVPRRIAAVALVCLGAVFVSVGVHNAVLAAGTGSTGIC